MQNRVPASRRIVLIGLLVAVSVVAGGAVLGALRGRGTTPANAAAPGGKVDILEFLPEDLVDVREGTLTRTLPITGTLTALNSATVKAKVAGELVAVTVREGQSVKQGQVLARIDQTEVQARVAARSADAEAARAQLSLAEKNRQTQKALLDKNFISRNAFDTTQSGYDVAVARLRAAEADLAAARKTLGDTILTAPFSGIVSERIAQPGERVPLDAKIVSIVDLSNLTLEASVPASTVAQVKVGQPVAFRVDGFADRTFDGRIERINPATAPGSRSISIYALIQNRDGLLRGGLFAQGELIVDRIEHSLVIPASAIREDMGQTFVYAFENGILRRRAVKVGQTDANGTIRVLSGLSPGERIVRSNLGQLRDGIAVRVPRKVAAETTPRASTD